MNTTEYERLMQAGIWFVSYRPRSEKEIRGYLAKKLETYRMSDPTLIERVMTRLRELDYVNDDKFAAWWISQRQGHAPKGMRLISRELKEKGIEIDMRHAENETDLACRAVEKKMLRWRGLPLVEQKRKLYGFLGRRGFAPETIARVIDELVPGRVQ